MLGRVQREIIWSAFMAGDWQIVCAPGTDANTHRGRMEAVRTLQAWGLAELGQITDFRLSPVRPRAAVRLTRLGITFAQVFATELRHGTRLRAKKFEDATGMRGAWVLPAGHGSWLRNSHAA